jgi:hypothetical protein
MLDANVCFRPIADISLRCENSRMGRLLLASAFCALMVLSSASQAQERSEEECSRLQPAIRSTSRDGYVHVQSREFAAATHRCSLTTAKKRVAHAGRLDREGAQSLARFP